MGEATRTSFLAWRRARSIVPIVIGSVPPCRRTVDSYHANTSVAESSTAMVRDSTQSCPKRSARK